MKKILYIVLFMGILGVLIVLFGLAYRKIQIQKIETYSQDISRQIVAGMDDETMIRQLFMFYFQLDDYKSLKQLMPGGIFIHTNNIPLTAENEQDLALLDSDIEKINDLYRKSGKLQPFYSIDQEGGRVRRIKKGITEFPSAMAVGEAYAVSGRTDLAMLTGFYNCIQLRAHGIQWPLTPVADVQDNPDNPVIGVRSFGSDPQLVTVMVKNYVMGAQNARCMTSVKHFPGHGSTSLDSHTNLPIMHKAPEEIEETELYPYKHIIHDKHAPYGIMSAHIIFDQISSQPATLSYDWLTKKMREELHFKGIIITDDLAMNAVNIYTKENPGVVKGNYGPAVQAFLAGADILLFVFKPAESIVMLNKFMAAYHNKVISRQRIVESVQRIVYRKVKMGLLDQYIQDHLSQWPAKEQKEAEVLLAYSKEVELNIVNIQTQLARPESVNEFISKNGIKTIWGYPSKDIKVQSYPLFTDDPDIKEKLAEKNAKQLKGADAKNTKPKAVPVIYSFDQIGRVPCPERCVILETQNRPLEWLLQKINQKKSQAKERKPWIIYTISDPFPRKKYEKYLAPSDILITSFSGTLESRKELIETYLEEKIPPTAKVFYRDLSK